MHKQAMILSLLVQSSGQHCGVAGNEPGLQPVACRLNFQVGHHIVPLSKCLAKLLK